MSVFWKSYRDLSLLRVLEESLNTVNPIQLLHLSGTKNYPDIIHLAGAITPQGLPFSLKVFLFSFTLLHFFRTLLF